jgi:hypothetical protein
MVVAEFVLTARLSSSVEFLTAEFAEKTKEI